MIITSLLDTDLYKFTMMQVVLHHFPGAQAEYRFKCRTPGIDLRPHVPEIVEEIQNLSWITCAGCASSRATSSISSACSR